MTRHVVGPAGLTAVVSPLRGGHPDTGSGVTPVLNSRGNLWPKSASAEHRASQMTRHVVGPARLPAVVIPLRGGHPDTGSGVTPVLNSRGNLWPKSASAEHRASQMTRHVVGPAGLPAVVRVGGRTNSELMRFDFT